MALIMALKMALIIALNMALNMALNYLYNQLRILIYVNVKIKIVSFLIVKGQIGDFSRNREIICNKQIPSPTPPYGSPLTLQRVVNFYHRCKNVKFGWCGPR